MDENFPLSQGVQPWAELPLWIPDMPDTAGFWAVSGSSAKAAGLRPRPFGDSVRDTWEWLRSGGEVQAAPGTPPFGSPAAKNSRCWPPGTPSRSETADPPNPATNPLAVAPLYVVNQVANDLVSAEVFTHSGTP